MDEKRILQFIEWLGTNVPELKGQSPDQIMTVINQLAESPEGQQTLEGLVQQFESSSKEMFKKGGKLDYLLCLKKGGNIQTCGCGKKINKHENGKVLRSPVISKFLSGITNNNKSNAAGIAGAVLAQNAVKGIQSPTRPVVPPRQTFVPETSQKFIKPKRTL